MKQGVQLLLLDAYEENSKLKKDWELIMSYNPKTIYYAHANDKNIRQTSPTQIRRNNGNKIY